MAYSRWSTSRWYVYGYAQDEVSEPFLVIDCFADGLTLEEAKNADNRSLARKFPDATPEEISELLGYVKQWVVDEQERQP